MSVNVLNSERVLAAKRAFTTRRVPIENMQSLLSGSLKPVTGQLVLAIVNEIGKQQRIELTDGRRARIFPGDEIIVCFGNRYAPDQYEALIGDDLSGCDLVAAGGIAAKEICRHERMIEPTRILPVGLVGNKYNQPLNVADFAVQTDGAPTPIPTILVLGTSMNSGKTTTAASLIRGFHMSGKKVFGIKATGTGSGGDLWYMKDIGAHHVMDFTDAGLASTYQESPLNIENAVLNLINHATTTDCDIAIVEIADGLAHEETAHLLNSTKLRERSLGVVFAASDPLGAKAGTSELDQLGYHVFAISGQLTRSPLAIRETINSTGIAVFTPNQLQTGIPGQSMLEIRNSHPGSENNQPHLTVVQNSEHDSYVTPPETDGSRWIVRQKTRTQQDVFKSLSKQNFKRSKKTVVKDEYSESNLLNQSDAS